MRVGIALFAATVARCVAKDDDIPVITLPDLTQELTANAIKEEFSDNVPEWAESLSETGYYAPEGGQAPRGLASENIPDWAASAVQTGYYGPNGWVPGHSSGSTGAMSTSSGIPAWAASAAQTGYFGPNGWVPGTSGQSTGTMAMPGEIPTWAASALETGYYGPQGWVPGSGGSTGTMAGGLPEWATGAAESGYYGPQGWVPGTAQGGQAPGGTSKTAVVGLSVAGAFVGMVTLFAAGIVIRRRVVAGRASSAGPGTRKHSRRVVPAASYRRIRAASGGDEGVTELQSLAESSEQTATDTGNIDVTASGSADEAAEKRESSKGKGGGKSKKRDQRVAPTK